MINRAYIEVMTDGRRARAASSRSRSRPTTSRTDFDWDSANADALFAMTAKYGLPYFQNFLNSELKPEHDPLDVLPPAARPARAAQARQRPVRLGRADRLARRGHDQLRAARATCTAGDEAGAARARSTGCWTWRSDSLEIKRKVIQRLHRRGPVPVHQALPRHAAQPLLDDRRQRHQRDGAQLHAATRTTSPTPTGPRASRCACSTTCARACVEFQEETGHLYNLEATPAEGTTYRFAKEDRKRLPGHPAGRHRPTTPYYTNSSQLPVGFTDDPFEALERQDELQTQVHRRHGAAPVHGRAAVAAPRPAARWCGAR